jgi:hypothetical protein
MLTEGPVSKMASQQEKAFCVLPAVSMRSELLVAHEKLGQLPLLTVYVLPR